MIGFVERPLGPHQRAILKLMAESQELLTEEQIVAAMTVIPPKQRQAHVRKILAGLIRRGLIRKECHYMPQREANDASSNT